jgi:uncharacterized protein (DUF3084 family)
MPLDRPRLSNPTTLRALLLGVLIASALVTGIAFYQRNMAQRLTAQNEQMSAALRETQGQIENLTSRLNALAAAPAPTPAPTPARGPALERPAEVRNPNPAHVRRDDPRWKKLQAQLDAQGKQIGVQGSQIDATRQELSDSRTELQGSIARTHDEVVLLQKKGERNYYEFDLGKNKQFLAKGPLGIRLKKANAKHQYADLELMVDDAQLGQKHVNLFQPVTFYAGDNGRPVELVINSIGKDRIRGYVSEPKYRDSQLASASPSATGDNRTAPSTDDPVSTGRRKLELPK